MGLPIVLVYLTCSRLQLSAISEFFKKDFFLFVHERQRERQRYRQREKQAPFGEPDVGHDPRTLGS